MDSGLTGSSASVSVGQGGRSGGVPASKGSSGQSSVSSGTASVKSASPAPVPNSSVSTTAAVSITESVTAPLPTDAVTYTLEITDSQGSVTAEVIEVETSSSVPVTSVLFAFADSVTIPGTALPTGGSIQTITTSTCTTAGAVITTTFSGSTVAIEIPELCTHGLAFLIFGLPAFHSSSDLPSLCHKSFSFLLEIIWQVLCPSSGQPNISIISVDPTKLPSGGGPPGQKPNDGTPNDQKPITNPTQIQKPSQTSSQTASFTVSSSAAATPTRYVVMPLFNISQSAIDSFFALCAHRSGITAPRRSNGSLNSLLWSSTSMRLLPLMLTLISYLTRNRT